MNGDAKDGPAELPKISIDTAGPVHAPPVDEGLSANSSASVTDTAITDTAVTNTAFPVTDTELPQIPTITEVDENSREDTFDNIEIIESVSKNVAQPTVTQGGNVNTSTDQRDSATFNLSVGAPTTSSSTDVVELKRSSLDIGRLNSSVEDNESSTDNDLDNETFQPSETSEALMPARASANEQVCMDAADGPETTGIADESIEKFRRY